MSVGAVGASSGNQALWGKLQESMQSRKAEAPETEQGQSKPTPAPVQHRVSGASPSMRGSLIDIKA